MPDNVIRRNVVLLHELADEPLGIVQHLFLEEPVRIIRPNALRIDLLRPQLHADRVPVPALRMQRTVSAVPHHVRVLYAPVNDVALVYGVVYAGSGLRIFEPLGHAGGGAERAEVVDDNPFRRAAARAVVYRRERILCLGGE